MSCIDRLASHPRRRWLRFSLRGLLLLVLAFAVAIGWPLHQLWRQKMAIRALRSMKCQVYECGEGARPLPGVAYRNG